MNQVRTIDAMEVPEEADGAPVHIADAVRTVADGSARTRQPLPPRRDVALALPLEEQVGHVLTYRMVLPFLPPSKNVYNGWQREWQSGAKSKWIRWIRRECEAQDMPKGVPKIGLFAVLVFPSRQRRDPQNYAETLWHFVPDALIKPTAWHYAKAASNPKFELPYGLINDDSEGHVEIGPNWGIRFAYDLSSRSKLQRQRTHLAIAVEVP